MDELQGMQERAHAWGRKNRVSFDPGKENFVILHPLVHAGDTFKLLGTLVDPSLSMRPVSNRSCLRLALRLEIF